MPKKHWRDLSQKTRNWMNKQDAQRSIDYLKETEDRIEEYCKVTGITREQYTAMKAAECFDIFGANEEEYDARHSA